MENRKDCHETSLEYINTAWCHLDTKGSGSARNLQDQHEIMIVYHVMYNQSHVAVFTEHNIEQIPTCRKLDFFTCLQLTLDPPFSISICTIS